MEVLDPQAWGTRSFRFLAFVGFLFSWVWVVFLGSLRNPKSSKTLPAPHQQVRGMPDKTHTAGVDECVAGRAEKQKKQKKIKNKTKLEIKKKKERREPAESGVPRRRSASSWVAWCGGRRGRARQRRRQCCAWPRQGRPRGRGREGLRGKKTHRDGFYLHFWVHPR